MGKIHKSHFYDTEVIITIAISNNIHIRAQLYDSLKDVFIASGIILDNMYKQGF